MRPGRAARAVALPVLLTVGGCGGAGTGAWSAICLEGTVERWSLPAEIDEASGLAVGRDGLVWTHNDGPEGVLYGLELSAGSGEAVVAQRVRVPAAFRDVEDLEAAPCRSDASTWCLYLADTGDNLEQRDRVMIVGIPEPTPERSSVDPARVERYALVFPDRPHDVEAFVVDDDGAFLLLTKGRSMPPTWYRAAPGSAAGEAVGETPGGEPQAALPAPEMLVRVGAAGTSTPSIPDQVTAAAAVRGLPGRPAQAGLALVRTYQALELHEIGATEARRVAGPLSIAHLGERQGEGLTVAPDGAVLLASEAGPLGGVGGVIRLRCGG